MTGKKQKQMEERLTAKEVAELLNVGRSTINLWCRNGTLQGALQEQTPFGSVWYIPKSSLVNFNAPERGRPKKASAKK
jgi:excisionase family DNA binding protein